MRTFATFVILLVTVKTLKTFEISPKIMNGFDSKRGEYPFYAFLIMKLAIKNVSWCGGSLISNQFILTAAHCTAPAINMSVHLGTWNARRGNETGRHGEFVRKENIYIHPYYNENFLTNDISLIKLEKPIKFTKNIQPIRLQNTCQPNENANVIVVGNGYFSPEHKIAPILQWVPMKTVSIFECRKHFAFLHFTIQNDVICAKNTDKRSIGRGDSGGPLVRDGTLIGVCSFLPQEYANSSRQQVPSSEPQGFVKLSAYHGWINQITKLKLKICYA